MKNDWWLEESRRDKIMLSGEFACSLTPEESNEWFEHCNGSQELRSLILERRALEIDSPMTDEQLAARTDSYLKAVRVMHEFAKEWFAGLVERRAAAKDAHEKLAKLAAERS